MTRWASLDGWLPDPDPEFGGYLIHPRHHSDTRRDRLGHWYSKKSISEARSAVDEALQVDDPEAVARLRRRLREIGGRS